MRKCCDPAAEHDVEAVRVKAVEHPLRRAGGGRSAQSAPLAHARGLQNLVGKLRAVLRDCRERSSAAELRDQAQHDQSRQGETPTRRECGSGTSTSGSRRPGMRFSSKGPGNA